MRLKLFPVVFVLCALILLVTIGVMLPGQEIRGQQGTSTQEELLFVGSGDVAQLAIIQEQPLRLQIYLDDLAKEQDELEIVIIKGAERIRFVIPLKEK